MRKIICLLPGKETLGISWAGRTRRTSPPGWKGLDWPPPWNRGGAAAAREATKKASGSAFFRRLGLFFSRHLTRREMKLLRCCYCGVTLLRFPPSRLWSLASSDRGARKKAVMRKPSSSESQRGEGIWKQKHGGSSSSNSHT